MNFPKLNSSRYRVWQNLMVLGANALIEVGQLPVKDDQPGDKPAIRLEIRHPDGSEVVVLANIVYRNEECSIEVLYQPTSEGRKRDGITWCPGLERYFAKARATGWIELARGFHIQTHSGYDLYCQRTIKESLATTTIEPIGGLKAQGKFYM